MNTWFKNLKMKAKISVSLGLILALMLTLSTISIFGVRRLGADIQQMYDDPFIGLKSANDIRQITVSQFLLLQKMRDASPAEAKSLWAQMEATDGEAVKAIDEYDATIVMADDRANFDKLKGSMPGFEATHEKMPQAMESNDTAAKLAMLNEADKYFQEVLRPQLDQLVEWNVKHGADVLEGAHASLASVFKSIVVISVGAVLFALLLGWKLVSSVVPPVQQLVAKLDSVANKCVVGISEALQLVKNGDLTKRVTPSTTPSEYLSKDEIGTASATFNQMLGSLQTAISDYNTAMDSIADLVRTVDAQVSNVNQTSGSLSDAASSTNQAAQNVTQTLNEVRRAVEETSNTSEEIARASEQLATSAEQAASQMTLFQEMVLRVSEGTNVQTTATERAYEVAEGGGRALSDTINSMQDISNKMSGATTAIRNLGEKQAQISTIVQTISEIADQTNLLALNAAIEAARAGEHGRGFAVVAEEVRKLAERTGDATNEIGELIGLVQAEVNQAVSTIDGMSSSVEHGATTSESARVALDEIIQAISEVQNLAKENQVAATAMGKNAQTVEDAIAAVASVSEEAAASAQQLSATSEEMAHSTNGVADEVNRQTDLIGEVSNMAGDLHGGAEELRELISRFEYDKAA